MSRETLLEAMASALGVLVLASTLALLDRIDMQSVIVSGDGMGSALAAVKTVGGEATHEVRVEGIPGRHETVAMLESGIRYSPRLELDP